MSSHTNENFNGSADCHRFNLNGNPLVLASASPRRAEMLKNANIPFIIAPADIDEHGIHADSIESLPEKIALAKAKAIAPKFPEHTILAADTIVCLDGRLFGKPHDMQEARHFLKALSGKTHNVITGVALLKDNDAAIWHAISEVTFHQLTNDIINGYFSFVNPLDKAGAYAIQEHGDMIVSGITGLKSNIIGLPIEEILERLTI